MHIMHQVSCCTYCFCTCASDGRRMLPLQFTRSSSPLARAAKPLQSPCSWLQNGNVRAKNARAILLKNCIDKLVGGICYWAVGFAFAYGSSSNGFIG